MSSPIFLQLTPSDSPVPSAARFPFAMPLIALLAIATTATASAATHPSATSSAEPAAQEKPHLFKRNTVPYTRFATSVEAFGDLNQDGNDDLLVSSRSFIGPGHVQIVSGVDGRPLITCTDFDNRWAFGSRVCHLDDVDGDGVQDFVVSALKRDASQPLYGARVGVYSGATGARLWFFEPSITNERFGFDLDSIGDQNGDGVRDVLVGSPGGGTSGGTSPLNAGAVTVLSGADGAVLRRIDGTTTNALMGMTVSRLDDIDADGIEDYLVGVPGVAGLAGVGGGEVRIYSGASGQVIRRILGRWDGHGVGSHCDDVGDVDGDGLSDFLVSTGSGSPQTSFKRILVVSSRSATILMAVRRPELPSYEAVYLSPQAAGVGDANGDGRPDIAYGVSLNPVQAGFSKVRVVDALTGDLIFESENVRPTTQGNAWQLSRAGDLNGDGRDDVVCSMPNYSQHAPWSGALLTYLAPTP